MVIYLGRGAKSGDWEILVLSMDNDLSVPFTLDLRAMKIEKLDPRYDIAEHSPDGFAWGYMGSGPAQASLALLCHAVGEDVARLHYNEFMRCLARIPKEQDWIMSSDTVIAMFEEVRFHSALPWKGVR